MAKRKYEDNFTEAPLHLSKENNPRNMLDFVTEKIVTGSNIGVFLVPIIAPTSVLDPHKHDFHQFLCFLGGDPNHMEDYGAEVEISLGEEGEKYFINTPTILHITPGLIHCPLVYKKVDKPVYQLDIYLAPKYERELVADT